MYYSSTSNVQTMKGKGRRVLSKRKTNHCKGRGSFFTHMKKVYGVLSSIKSITRVSSFSKYKVSDRMEEFHMWSTVRVASNFIKISTTDMSLSCGTSVPLRPSLYLRLGYVVSWSITIQNQFKVSFV